MTAASRNAPNATQTATGKPRKRCSAKSRIEASFSFIA
jgi:hypothetical protein